MVDNACKGVTYLLTYFVLTMEGLVFDPMVAKMVSFSENFDFHFLSDFIANLCAILIFSFLGKIYFFVKKVIFYLCVYAF